MPNEEGGEKKGHGGFTKLMATFGSMLIIFFAGLIWRSYEKTGEAIDIMQKRLERLEEDKSKWGTLTELHNRVTTMDREVYRMQGVFDYAAAVEGGVPKPPQAKPPTQPELPKPPPTAQQLVPPSELFRDPDAYRKIQEQKYPTKK